jgi:2-dehydro-3-deoxyphosphogluconate aldolase/(4S)-4-hydroxy-2-oxoglutarate aldolase
MKTSEIYRRIEELKVIPVIVIDELKSALPLAQTLVEGGLSIVEITFRTDVAAEAIKMICKEYPELLIGAGTVLSIDNLKRAYDSGAKFAVAPGLNPGVIEESLKISLPFIPGVMTPSDIEAALNYKLKVLKFFPAEASGGIDYFKNVIAPYLHTGVKFIPLGGINLHNFLDYLALESVLAIGGTWIAKKEDILKNNWQQVIKNCKELKSKLQELEKIRV